jgi:uncharacterized membrane protein YccC
MRLLEYIVLTACVVCLMMLSATTPSMDDFLRGLGVGILAGPARDLVAGLKKDSA